jgi:flagellar biosynthesis protein FliR
MFEAALAALTAHLPLFGLASLRIALVFAALPAPFGGVAPIRIRTAFTIVTAIALILPQLGQLPALPMVPAVLLRAALYELVLGMVIGLSVRVTLAAAEVAGTIAGQAMGLGFATSVDPTHGESVLPTTHLLDMVCTFIFFALDFHHVLLAALAGSFRAAPIGQGISSALSHGVIQLGADLCARGLQIAAPVVATMFIVQLATAFVSRTAPRVHLFAFAFSVSIAAGIVVLWLAAPSVYTAIGVQVRRLPDALTMLGAF